MVVLQLPRKNRASFAVLVLFPSYGHHLYNSSCVYQPDSVSNPARSQLEFFPVLVSALENGLP